MPRTILRVVLRVAVASVTRKSYMDHWRYSGAYLPGGCWGGGGCAAPTF